MIAVGLLLCGGAGFPSSLEAKSLSSLKSDLLKAMKAKKMGGDKAAFRAAWMKTRAAALEKAGFDPIWRQ